VTAPAVHLRRPFFEYGFALACVALSTAGAFALFPVLERTNLVMLYLLGTVIVASRGQRGPAALSSVLSVVCFDFFFVPPRFTLSVSDAQYLWTFAVMLAVAMVISHLTIRLREEADAARQGEQRTAWLMEKAKKAEIAAETEHLRSSLLSSVSHDFRTPLAAILGSASALLQKEIFQKSADARDLLENIEDEAQRLSRLVQNLLEVTRLESSTVHLQKQLYPLEEVVGSALERCEKSLQGREVVVTIPELLPMVPMDAILMEQVFINLLENAARHAPSKSAIEIAAEQKDAQVSVSIADRGPGLAPHELESIFEKFYHGKTSPGAGLGLAICRAVIKAQGGRITAENRPGGGALFRFEIPLKGSDEN
jgi:two-component system sensor histidine kinase KdpD